MEWKKININKNLIKQETEKAVLIAMPHNSSYDGYAFWHPKKLVREGRNSAAVSISYTDSFEFRLRKKDDEIALSPEELEEEFLLVDHNISSPVRKNINETHIPAPVQATEHEALEELKDD